MKTVLLILGLVIAAQAYNYLGYDANGYDAAGYDRQGYNHDGYDRTLCTRAGSDAYGTQCVHVTPPQDPQKVGCIPTRYQVAAAVPADSPCGYYMSDTGFDCSGYNGAGFDRYGYDNQGYDQSGFDIYGWDRNGVDRDGCLKYW